MQYRVPSTQLTGWTSTKPEVLPLSGLINQIAVKADLYILIERFSSLLMKTLRWNERRGAVCGWYAVTCPVYGIIFRESDLFILIWSTDTFI